MRPKLRAVDDGVRLSEMKVLTQCMTQYILSHHELGSNCNSLSIQARRAAAKQSNQARGHLLQPSFSLMQTQVYFQQAAPPEGTRVETGKGGEMGLGKNGPFVSPNGSFVGGGVT